MTETLTFWPLAGLAVIVVGLLLRFNTVLVVIVAGIVSGLAAHIPFLDLLQKIGKGFLDTRNLSLTLLLPLMVIGLLERHGLRERAHQLIVRFRRATTGRLLMVYLFLREASAALGLTSLGGHPQMVRPLLAPMAEAAAEKEHGELTPEVSAEVRAMSAATDNVGLFFGEDIFVAFGAILFMHNFMNDSLGLPTDPMLIAVWGIPTAFIAFVIHSTRLYRFDLYLRVKLDSLRPRPEGKDV